MMISQALESPHSSSTPSTLISQLRIPFLQSIQQRATKTFNRVCYHINEEIKNSYFVLHDSQGVERNEIDNLDKVKKFIRSRSGEAIPLKDRVHAIW